MAHIEKFIEVLDNIAKKQKYTNYNVTVQPLSTGGANYSSILFLATIFAQGKKDLHLFCKVAAMGKNFRSKMPLRIYDIEQFAYTELVKTYEDLQYKYDVPREDRLVFAKYYGRKATLCEETIVLENLQTRGFQMFDRFTSIDWPYASAAVEVMAKFHAVSMAHSEVNPEQFIKDCERIHFEISDKENNGYMFQLLNKAVDASQEKYKNKLRRYLVKSMNMEAMTKFNIARKPILVHGDYRPSNLMHRINNDGSIEVIPVDLQTLRKGCGLSDLMYFIFAGSDGAFRDQYYEKLVEHYYERLCYALRTLHLDPDSVYPREDFDYELQKFLPFGLISGVLTLPLVTVEIENVPDLDHESSIEALVTETSDLYAQRINEIVEDYIRWGVL